VSYRVELKRSASKALDPIPEPDRARILTALSGLTSNPRPPGCAKLSGRDGWRIRSQNYRIIYEIDDKTKSVVVLMIGHRRDIYR
jgi:mRNA interferase RelE/StbE